MPSAADAQRAAEQEQIVRDLKEGREQVGVGTNQEVQGKMKAVITAVKNVQDKVSTLGTGVFEQFKNYINGIAALEITIPNTVDGADADALQQTFSEQLDQKINVLRGSDNEALRELHRGMDLALNRIRFRRDMAAHLDGLPEENVVGRLFEQKLDRLEGQISGAPGEEQSRQRMEFRNEMIGYVDLVKEMRGKGAQSIGTAQVSPNGVAVQGRTAAEGHFFYNYWTEMKDGVPVMYSLDSVYGRVQMFNPGGAGEGSNAWVYVDNPTLEADNARPATERRRNNNYEARFRIPPAELANYKPTLEDLRAAGITLQQLENNFRRNMVFINPEDRGFAQAENYAPDDGRPINVRREEGRRSNAYIRDQNLIRGLHAARKEAFNQFKQQQENLYTSSDPAVARYASYGSPSREFYSWSTAPTSSSASLAGKLQEILEALDLTAPLPSEAGEEKEGVDDTPERTSARPRDMKRTLDWGSVEVPPGSRQDLFELSAGPQHSGGQLYVSSVKRNGRPIFHERVYGVDPNTNMLFIDTNAIGRSEQLQEGDTLEVEIVETGIPLVGDREKRTITITIGRETPLADRELGLRPQEDLVRTGDHYELQSGAIDTSRTLAELSPLEAGYVTSLNPNRKVSLGATELADGVITMTNGELKFDRDAVTPHAVLGMNQTLTIPVVVTPPAIAGQPAPTPVEKTIQIEIAGLPPAQEADAQFTDTLNRNPRQGELPVGYVIGELNQASHTGVSQEVISCIIKDSNPPENIRTRIDPSTREISLLEEVPSGKTIVLVTRATVDGRTQNPEQTTEITANPLVTELPDSETTLTNHPNQRIQVPGNIAIDDVLLTLNDLPDGLRNREVVSAFYQPPGSLPIMIGTEIVDNEVIFKGGTILMGSFVTPFNDLPPGGQLMIQIRGTNQAGTPTSNTQTIEAQVEALRTPPSADHIALVEGQRSAFAQGNLEGADFSVDMKPKSELPADISRSLVDVVGNTGGLTKADFTFNERTGRLQLKPGKSLPAGIGSPNEVRLSFLIENASGDTRRESLSFTIAEQPIPPLQDNMAYFANGSNSDTISFGDISSPQIIATMAELPDEVNRQLASATIYRQQGGQEVALPLPVGFSITGPHLIDAFGEVTLMSALGAVNPPPPFSAVSPISPAPDLMRGDRIELNWSVSHSSSVVGSRRGTPREVTTTLNIN